MKLFRPSVLPSFRPSVLPSFRPSVLPSFRPSVLPSLATLLLSSILFACNTTVNTLPSEEKYSYYTTLSVKPKSVVLSYSGNEEYSKPTLENLDGTPYYEQNSIVERAVSVIKTEWLPKELWTKVLTHSPRESCQTRSFTASVTGSYTSSISAGGDILVVKVSGSVGGTFSLTAGQTKTWNVCALYQITEKQIYRRWEQWAYYSNGTSKWTGGVSNLLQPGKVGDVVDKRVSEWIIK